MKDITIQSNLKDLGGFGVPGNLDTKKIGAEEEGASFANTLPESLDKVNDMQKEADKAIEDLATGKTRNIHETMIAVNKADLAFRLTMQVRNKIVEAYQEVMRTQI